MGEVGRSESLRELDAVKIGMGMHAAALFYASEVATEFGDPRKISDTLGAVCSILQLSAPADQHEPLELARGVMQKRAEEGRLNLLDLLGPLAVQNDLLFPPIDDPLTQVEIDEAKARSLANFYADDPK